MGSLTPLKLRQYVNNHGTSVTPYGKLFEIRSWNGHSYKGSQSAQFVLKHCQVLSQKAPLRPAETNVGVRHPKAPCR